MSELSHDSDMDDSTPNSPECSLLETDTFSEDTDNESENRSRNGQQVTGQALVTQAKTFKRRGKASGMGSNPCKKAFAASSAKEAGKESTTPQPDTEQAGGSADKSDPKDAAAGPIPPDRDPKKLFVYDPVNRLVIPWTDFYKLPENVRKSVAPPTPLRSPKATKCCLRCGYWIVHFHNKCKRNKSLGDYSFEPPPDLLSRGKVRQVSPDKNFSDTSSSPLTNGTYPFSPLFTLLTYSAPQLPSRTSQPKQDPTSPT